MIIISKVFFWLSGFTIFWAMIGYPLVLLLINKYCKIKDEIKKYENIPTVTVMVVAHNEEKVILDKLNNIISLDYPKEKIQFIIASDNSTDMTNKIVKAFIEENSNYNIRLHKTKKRMGKTNAQNEAQKIVETEMLVMTDANSILNEKAIRELMASFSSREIAYVTGKLVFTNTEKNEVSESEADYWNLDIAMRDVESRILTITAGNGALYAVRNAEYVDFKPIESHDSSMPIYYGLQQKRAIMNTSALAYEKAGETHEDEFQRKVRMNRLILAHILPDIKLLNVFKYKWFTFFYFGHRTCRYLLWLSHTLLLLLSFHLFQESIIYSVICVFQIIIFTLAISKEVLITDSKIITNLNYYLLTILAQWVGVLKILTGRAKPFWEKAETTR